jgi:hypothetical protein
MRARNSYSPIGGAKNLFAKTLARITRLYRRILEWLYGTPYNEFIRTMT